MRKRRLPFWLPWRLIAFLGMAAIVIGAALLYRLASLAPRLSPAEAQTLTGSTHWHLLLDNPQNLPYRLLVRLAAYAPPQFGHTLILARLPSILLGALAAALMLYVLRRWYGRRTMVFGFLMFIASAWFLHISRFAGVDIEYLTAIVGLIAAHALLYTSDENLPAAYVWLLTNLLCLFVPGMLWFVAAGILLQLPELRNAWRAADSWWPRSSWVVIALISLALPVYSIVRRPSLWRSWLGIPQHFGNWTDIAHRLIDTVLTFAVRGPHDPQLWLGQLPLLDAFVIVMFLAGAVFYARHWRAARTRLLLTYLALGVILVTLGGTVRLSVMLPVMYLVAAGGVAYVLYFWLKKFPRNMFARVFGIALIAAVLGLSCLYNLTQYFVAWPHNPEVSAIYRPNR